MQLATRQRAHPPPVPPRPSRHVVAEALKRTPRRPPCPTRQAPPPPNTRPWRSEDHETAAGRTVVYESAREHQNNGEQVRCSSEPRSLKELQRSLASSRCCNDETHNYGNNIAGGNTASNVVQKKEERRDSATNRTASERSLLQQPMQQQPPAPLLMKSRRSISDDNILAHNQTANFGLTHLLQRNTDPRIQVQVNETEEKVFLKLIPGIGDEYSEISQPEIETQLNGTVNKNMTKLEEIARTEIRSEDDGRSQKRSSVLLTDETCSQGQVRPETGLSTTPTTFEKTPNDSIKKDRAKVVGVCNADEESISPGVAKKTISAPDPSSGTGTPISSDDCATVVVIEEAERKIADNDDNDNIYHQDWLEAGIRYSSTKITLPGDDLFDRADEFPSIDDNRDNGDDQTRAYTKLDCPRIRERMSMSSLQGLPPLPRSLSGFNLSEGRRESAEPPPPPTRSSSKTQKNFKSTQSSSSRPSPPGRQLTTLDTQLAILRKEMFGLRQLDLSLLSQLWSLNESIQEFRQLLQEQEDRAPSPSPSSEEGDDNSYGSHPPPPPRRPAPLLHHHRPPRLPRPLRPPASDESPSSEEYGAV